MITIDTFRQLALSFPETTEQPHFEKTSFRVRKKIFATYDSKTNLASVKLSETEQDLFSTFDKSIVWPVPNKWGKQGWTLLDLANIPAETFIDALTTAYRTVAPAHRSDRHVRE
ncbi:MmcQ/YjbR family DNA-binding protein [uncultured Fibrella sp.]|uniref:MmcQ/YjbR family DNA-binding protein n=1 Tax=uncultured Fibrella sp. TaxID=1284596 RepID=UPI0035C956A1